MRTGDQAEPLLEHLVFEVARGIASETGPRFFQSLVQHLARALPADFVFAGALKPGANRVVALAVFGDTGDAPPEEFDLAHTPFQELAAKGPAAHSGDAFSYSEAAADLFPNDPILRRIPGDGYIGAPLVDSSGNLLGLVSAVTRRRLEHTSVAEELIRILSVRAAAELERTKRFETLEHQAAALEREMAALELHNAELRREAAEGAGLISRLRRENAGPPDEIATGRGFAEMAGNSAEFRALIGRIRLMASTSACVLIHGEPGTGKQLAARAIHRLSPIRSRPLVRIDCDSIPAAWLESELASSLRRAHGGTLLIHEVAAELPLAAQRKLLRVIEQQREFRPPGSDRAANADVRLLLTTNRNLEQAVREGRFRSDLYQCLDLLEVPPLRRRRQDIPLLAEHFLSLHVRRLGRAAVRVSDRMMRQMSAYDWPGNVRELEDFLFRAVLSPHEVLDLPVPLPDASASSDEPVTLEQAERCHVGRTLVSCNWVIEGPKGAAAVLEVPPSTLRSLMKRLGIRRARLPLAD